MEDTAQATPAETPAHEQVNSAAAAIKAMREQREQPRDEAGRFAGEQPEPEPQETEEVDYGADEGEEYDETEELDAEGSDEDQPEAVEMPKSWSKDDVDLWHSLSPDAQQKIADREGQRDAAINSKFQEVANARKEYESKLQEANSSRDKWAQDYDLLVADLSLPKPDPREYGLGTQNYNREAYDIAMLQWEEGTSQLDGLKKQREEIRAQQEQEANEAWQARKAEIEAEYAPKLISMMPELQDPQKAEPAMRGLVDYALQNGLEPETFSEANQPYITAAQLALLAKAKKFDELSQGKSKPAPKKQPAVRPGVSTPRSAQKKVIKQKAIGRLEQTGSIDDAVAAMRALRR